MAGAEDSFKKCNFHPARGLHTAFMPFDSAWGPLIIKYGLYAAPDTVVKASHSTPEPITQVRWLLPMR
jgi:hypothetical protein